MDKKKLIKTIENFLEERIESLDGGWPEVSEKDYKELVEIIDTIIEFKWESDSGGCRPIIPILNDRTRYEMIFYNQIIYDTYFDDEKQLTKEEFLRRLRSLNYNVKIAQDQLSNTLDKITNLDRMDRFDDER